MPFHSIAHLVLEIGRCRLLDASQMDELNRNLVPAFTDPRELIRDLVQRGWLTPFQANLLATGKGQELILGSYLLLDRLSEGMMGERYQARHQHMRRMVTLQIIRADLLEKPEAVQRFYEEIQATGQLTSPHIVAAYDAGPIGPTHFFAMEYVEGTDVERMVQESGPLAVAQACEYVYQAALGLNHACEQGLLHHDLKPANLLVQGRQPGETGRTPRANKHKTGLGPTGFLKVQNLGLTLMGQHKRRTKLKGTAETETPGTPDYLAPELAQDPKRRDVRSELYSLGCCMYFMLTGKLPFPGGTVADKLRCHQSEEPAPVDRLRGDLSPSVTAIVQKLMAKRPEDRFQTPEEVLVAMAPMRQAGSDVLALPTLPADAVPAYASRPQISLVDPHPEVSANASGRPMPLAVALQRAKRRRIWLLVNCLGGLLLLGLFVGFLFLLIGNRGAADSSARNSKADASRETRRKERLGIYFDGIDDVIEVPHKDDLDPPHLTIEAWIQVPTISATGESRRWLINKNFNEHAQSHYALVIAGAKVGAYLNIGGGPENCFQAWSGDVLTPDVWHHAAMTYDGSMLRVYYDGTKAAETPVNRPRVPGKSPLNIGRRQDGQSALNFKGRLDDIRLYNRALSAEEIKAHFDRPYDSVTKPEKGLVKFWRFERN